MFRKSSKCEATNCVEVDTDGAQVGVRDSKDPKSPIITFDVDAWRGFLDALSQGDH